MYIYTHPNAFCEFDSEFRGQGHSTNDDASRALLDEKVQNAQKPKGFCGAVHTSQDLLHCRCVERSRETYSL